MKRRLHVSEEDGQSISRRNTQSSTSIKGGENSEPIPIDLIFEVLSRLPAKSIARCRSVSKLWGSILARQDFTDLLFTKSSDRPLLLFSCVYDGEILFFSASPNPNGNSSLVAATYHMKFPFEHIMHTSEICGHVRGLVCLKHVRTVGKGRKETIPEICNPSTGQSWILPKVKTRRVQVRCFFVYDPISKQYKVLSMTWPSYNSGWICTEHQILTLGNRNLSWRMIECSTPHHPTFDGIYINGSLYYQAMVKADGSEISAIVCFDVSSEKFRLIEKAGGPEPWDEPFLVNYKGKLGLLASHGSHGLTEESRCIELWVLVDADKPEWSKVIYTFPPSWKNVVAGTTLHFVGMTSTNEILMSPQFPDGGQFYVIYYNLERNTLVKVEIQGTDAFKHGEIRTFLRHVEDVKLYAPFMGS